MSPASNLYVIPAAASRAPERPADLIRLAQPRLNKCDWVEEYLKQLKSGDYDTIWARVTETVQLDCEQWNDLMKNFLTDRDWLAAKGGCSSWAFSEGDSREWFQLSESEQALYRATAFSFVVKVVSPTGTAVYIDPQGYQYARYVSFDLAGVRPELSREEIRREQEKLRAEQRITELKRSIENPPAVPANHGLRFLWNGVKHNNGPLFKVSYSSGKLNHYPDETITVYASDYRRFPKEIAQWFTIENNTESQSDYFDDDKFRVCPNHTLYKFVKDALDAQEKHRERVISKRRSR